MKVAGTPTWWWMSGIVFIHLIVSAVHGAAHVRANVPLSPAANLFVFGVILMGPVAGVALTWPAERIGAWVVAASMAAALVFGAVNHFALGGPDHVGGVAAAWRGLFAITAALLAATEALGAAVAVRLAWERTTS